MFDLDAGKLIVIGIVALIAIPSKDLPRVLRTLGQATGRMRRMASEFQGQFMEALREAELDDLRKEVDEMKTAMNESVKLEGAFDPMAEARKQIAGASENGGRKSPPARDSSSRSDVPPSDPEPRPPGAEGARPAAAPGDATEEDAGGRRAAPSDRTGQ